MHRGLMVMGWLAVGLSAISPASAASLERRPVRLDPERAAAESALVYQQDFLDGVLTEGASGEVVAGPGQDGTALYLVAPDGRFDVCAAEFPLAERGTVEWRVRPRPASNWWRNAGWYYFLHARPQQARGFQLDLWRHPLTGFRLSASKGMDLYGPADRPDERIQLDTAELDPQAWQRVTVSWDLAADPQKIWLLLNGEGLELVLPAGTFDPGAFAAFEFGNRPAGRNMPWLCMDGGIADIRIYSDSVASRLARDEGGAP